MKSVNNRYSFKTVFLLTTLLLFSIGVCSCNGNNALSVDTSTNFKKYLFVDSVVDLEEFNHNEELDYSDIHFSKEKIFLTNSQRNIVYSLSIGDSDISKEVFNLDDKEGLCTIGIAENNDKLQCALIVAYYNSDWELNYKAIFIDSVGENYEYNLSNIYMTDIVFAELNKENDFIVISSTGVVFVYSFNENDFTLNFKYKIEISDALNCIPLIVENYIYYFGSDEENAYLYKKDISTGKKVGSIILSAEDIESERLFITYNSEESESVIFSFGNEIYYTDFVNVALYSNKIPSFYEINHVTNCGDSLLFDLYDCSSNNIRHVLLMTHFENMNNIDSKSIIIGYSNENSIQLLNVLSEEYMMFHPNVNVQLVFYDVNSLEGLEKLRNDTNNDEGPMIFYLNSGDYALVDSVFDSCEIDNTDIFEQNEYNKCVIETINSFGDGKIVAPYYEVVGLTIPYEASLALNDEYYTINDFLHAASTSIYPEGITGDFDILTLYILMQEYSLAEDEATGILNHLYEIYDISIYHTEVFFHMCRISGFSDYYRYSTYYSDGMRIVGLPYLEDSLPLIALDNFFILNESCDEAGKDYIDFLYSAEAQRVILYDNKIPVLNSIICENKELKNSSMNSYIESTTGEDLSLLAVSEPDPQKEFDEYLFMLNSLHTVMNYDNNVETIINEEISLFISGAQDTYTTLNNYRERVNLYLAEIED